MLHITLFALVFNSEFQREVFTTNIIAKGLKQQLKWDYIACHSCLHITCTLTFTQLQEKSPIINTLYGKMHLCKCNPLVLYSKEPLVNKIKNQT